MSIENNMRYQLASITEHDVRTHRAVRTNLHRLWNDRPGLDQGSWMNAHSAAAPASTADSCGGCSVLRAGRGTNWHLISASHTNLPST